MPRQYPLDWPENSPRCKNREISRFKSSFDKALTGLRKELKCLDATHVLVSCNLPPARDGWPDSRARLKNEDPGVAVYWIINRITYVLACDSWDRVEDNLHAVTLTIAADRGKVRWGCSDVLKKTMGAYLSLPPPANQWWEIIGVPRESPLDEVRVIYRLRAKQNHPDSATSESDRKSRTEIMTQLNVAIEAAEKEKNVSHRYF